MPVYNGERFLAQALDSLLSQTFLDFELIISDNASTDATADICRSYAAHDRRIRYFRNEHNLGVAANYRRVFELSSGEYFKWAAHDDLWAPELLIRCIEILDEDPGIVLAHSGMSVIDENGHVVEHCNTGSHAAQTTPHRRFYERIRVTRRLPEIDGLIRSSVLKLVPPESDYSSADVALVARLALLGRIHEIPDYLVSRREHPDRITHFSRTERTIRTRVVGDARIALPEWQLYRELWMCVIEVPIPWSERAWCSLYLLCWPIWQRHWRSMARDVFNAILRLAGSPPGLVKSH